MREQLDDPLFLRSAQGLVPTHYTNDILPQIKFGLEQIEQAILPKKFEPENYTERIKLAIYIGTFEGYGPQIYTALTNRFPLATIELVVWSRTSSQQILSGETTMGIHIYNEEQPHLIYQQRISEDEIVILVDRTLPKPTWEQVINFPVIMLRIEGWNEQRTRSIEFLKQQGVTLNISSFTDSISMAMRLIKQRTLACVVPKCCATDDYHIIEFPDELRVRSDVVVCLKRTERNNPLHKILMKTLTDVFN
jgi:DNA-binding transcriptional LysR family regulator